MQNDLFYHLGKLIYTCRWFIILLWIILFIACLPILPKAFDPFKEIGFIDPGSQSAKTEKILDGQFGYGIHNRFIILYSSKTLKADSSEFQNEIYTSLANLKNFKVKHQIIYPDKNNTSQIAKDDSQLAYAVVAFKNDQNIDSEFLKKFKSYIKKPPTLKMKIGGEPIFMEDTRTQTQLDLAKAEIYGIPLAIITMLIVFGSVIAAGLPVILGGAGAIFILIGLHFLARVFDLSVFTINIALLLGICLSLDYSLFIISRFREEIKLAQSPNEALANTLLTSGKAIFFSGLAVFGSLSALLLFKVNILFSVGIGGLTAVFVSVAIAIILLPSILAVLNTRINALSLPFMDSNKHTRSHFWKYIGSKVIKYRFISFFSVIILLLFIGYPFLNVKVDTADFRILPKTMESRQVFDTLEKEFGDANMSPIFVIVKSHQGDILSSKNIARVFDLSSKLKKYKSIDEISSIVTIDPRLTKEQYQILYSHPEKFTPEMKNMMHLLVHKNLTFITVISKYPHGSAKTKALVNQLRQTRTGPLLSIEITGASVITQDVLSSIDQTFLYAFLWVLIFNYLIIMILLRSLFLPFKAVFMTMLSLFASYGVLVFVIQHGYGHELLNFEPQGMLDISLLIIIFCTLFGVSMDYEVFLLTRIKEGYEKTTNTNESILYGIDHSSKIITSAAIILILICLVFITADILMVKAFGLGIAIAVFIDAFLIRTILVPATMAIFKSWNWYIPEWLNKILPGISFKPPQKK